MNFMLKNFLISIGLFICQALESSCLYADVPEFLDPKVLHVSIIQDPKLDKWKIHYKLPDPVTSLTFQRQTNQFRRKNWIPLNPNMQIIQRDAKEIVVSKDGKPFKYFELELASYYEHTPKDYEFFLPFTDGSILLYTGHFNIVSMPMKFSMVGREGQNIVIVGRRFQNQTAELVDKEGSGTYVYFGNIDPIESKDMISIIDPGFPHWIRSKLESLMPLMFAYYAEKFQIPLTHKPTIFFSYKDPRKKNTGNNGGGILPGLIQLYLEGNNWQEETPENLEKFSHLLAHESAHLWNAQMMKTETFQDSWLHEGSAEAFTFQALRDLEIISKSRLEESINVRLSYCDLELTTSLADSYKDRKFRNYYHCGLQIALISELAMKQKNSSYSLYTLYRKIFELVRNKDSVYSWQDYLAALYSFTGDGKLIVQIKNMVFKENQFMGPAFDLYEKYGIENVSFADIPEGYDYRLIQNIFQNAVKASCSNTEVSFSVLKEKGIVRLPKNIECKHLNAPRDISKIGPYLVFKDTFKAYDLYSKSCRENGAISFFDSAANEEFVMACSPIKERPKLSFLKFP